MCERTRRVLWRVDTLNKEERAMLKTIPNSRWQFTRRFVVKHPIKLTALLYLKEALKNERYEVCPDIIEVAREYGAADFEIRDLLEDPRRSPG